MKLIRNIILFFKYYRKLKHLKKYDPYIYEE